MKPGAKGWSKYATWDEVEALFSDGHALLVYQHVARVNRRPFINGKLRELYTRLGVDQVTTFHSFDWIGFLLDPDDEHTVELSGAVQRITVEWQQRINVFRNVIVPMEPADAAVGERKRDARRERWTSAMKSTDAGYVNKNEQEVVSRTDRPGNDHGQRVYLLRCRKCNAEYGAHGSDIWIRKCPLCQGGKPGL